MTDQIILASGSPRRRELLKLLGLPFTVVVPESGQAGEEKSSRTGIDERPLPGESPPDLVQRLSRAKAQAAAAQLSRAAPADLSLPPTFEAQAALIIAADTVVVLEGQILGKPAGPDQARQMLKQLRQRRSHYVYTGLTVGRWRQRPQPVAAAQFKHPQPQIPEAGLLTRLNRSQVWMRPFTDAELEAYVATGDPLDKAGAYGIQNKSFAPVEHLDGCFANVMGLPLGDLADLLRSMDLSLPKVSPRCRQYTGHPCCQQTRS